MRTSGQPVPALRLDEVTKRFGSVTALDGVSLEVDPSELLALVGPSGCGKSTLLRAIAGLSPVDEGRIELAGEVVDERGRHLPPEGRRIGIVFQDHVLFPHLTVAANVAFGLRPLSRQQRKERVADALSLVALEGYAKRYPHELSGGERQRVALARALAPRPALVLFDEPFASLDPNLRAQLRSDVVQALRTTGTPAVFVTHDQTEALAIGDRVAVMRAGHLEQVGSPVEVFHHPTNRFVAAFMGEAAFVPIEHGTDGPSTPLGPLAPTPGSDRDAPADNLVAMVRPDDVRFRADEAGDAVVLGAEFRGSTWCYRLRLDEGLELLAEGSHLDPVAVGTRGRAELVPGHHQVPVPDES